MNLVRLQARVIFARGHLYKYKSVDGDSFNHVCEILRDSRIFFPRPSQLNDPEECKPTSTVGDIRDPQYRPAVEAWVRRCLAYNVPPPSEQRIQAELAQLTQEKLETLLKEVDLEYRVSVEDRYRILSLADSALNLHLWNEYAGAFSGVCLKFAVDSRFGTAYQVHYSDGDRTLDLTSVDDYEHLVMTGLIKRRKWRSEKEFRLIFGEPPIEDQPILVNQKYSFPSKFLEAVIVGNRMRAAQRARLVALAHARHPSPRCLIASPDPRSPSGVMLRPLTIWSTCR